MALVRFQPHDVFDLRGEMSRLSDSMHGNGGEPDYHPPTAWRPAIDIAEGVDGFILTTDVPGIERKDIDVSVVDNRLTIKGERKQENQSEGRHALRVERSYGAFSRAFDLPAAVNAGEIAATCLDGVLTVSVPKAESTKPRQIEITVN